MMTRSEPTADQGIHIRGAAPADQAFIASTWVSSLGMLEHPRASFERGQLVDRVLDKAGVAVSVACELGDRGRILGWLCHSPMPSVSCLHYLYVRNQVRRRGIGSALAVSTGLDLGRPVVYTLLGPSASWLLAKHPGATHLPIEEFLT